MSNFEQSIRDRAGEPRTLHRVGVPSIGETYGRRWNANRGTGGLGTGVYAFRTMEAAESNADEGQTVFMLRGALTNPVVPEDFSTTVAVNDMSKELARLIVRVSEGETTYEAAREDNPRRLRRKSRKVLFGTPQLSSLYGFETDVFVSEAIDAAQVAAEERDEIPAGTATQPINKLLYPQFDGVYPRGEAGDSGTYGCVVFKEKVDRCVNRVTKRAERIPAPRLNECFASGPND
jgi:hypothetical protein